MAFCRLLSGNQHQPVKFLRIIGDVGIRELKRVGFGQNRCAKIDPVRLQQIRFVLRLIRFAGRGVESEIKGRWTLDNRAKMRRDNGSDGFHADVVQSEIIRIIVKTELEQRAGVSGQRISADHAWRESRTQQRGRAGEGLVEERD